MGKGLNPRLRTQSDSLGEEGRGEEALVSRSACKLLTESNSAWLFLGGCVGGGRVVEGEGNETGIQTSSWKVKNVSVKGLSHFLHFFLALPLSFFLPPPPFMYHFDGPAWLVRVMTDSIPTWLVQAPAWLVNAMTKQSCMTGTGHDIAEINSG